MKSKVIIFCVLLFCSKFVESSPYAEELAGQRAYPAPNWPGNQNVPGQYHNNEYTQTHNVDTLTNPALQHDNSQDYNTYQGRHLYKSYGPNNNPTALPPMKESSINYDLPGDSYPPGVDLYQSRTSELGLNNQHFRNQNWRTQKQQSNSGSSGVLMSDQEKTVMPPREPYQVPVHSGPPIYVPSFNDNQRNYQEDKQYTRREPYPLIENSGDPKYVETYGIGHDTSIKRSGGQRYAKRPPFPSETTYNGGPAAVTADDLVDKFGTNYNRAPEGINSDVLTEKSQNVYNAGPPIINFDTLTPQSVNNRHLHKYKSHTGPSYIEPLSNYNHESSIITKPDNYETGSRAMKIAPVYNKNDVPAETRRITSNNYRPGSVWGKTAPDDSYNDAPIAIKKENENYESGFEQSPKIYNGAPTVIRSENEYYQSWFEPNKYKYNDAPTVITSENENYRSGYEPTQNSYNDKPAVIKSGNDNYESGVNNPVPISSYKYPLKPTSDAPLTYPGNTKPEDNSVPQNGQNNPAHRIQNVYQKSPSGIHNYDFKNITSNPYIKKLLTSSKKRYVKIHKNGTVEYLDRIEDSMSNEKNSNFRLVHANRDKPYDTKDDWGGDEEYTTKSPVTSTSSSPISTTPLHVEKHTLSPNENRPLDKDSLPINKNPPVIHKHSLHRHSLHKHSSHNHPPVERHTLSPVEHTLPPDVPASHIISKPIHKVPSDSDEDSPVTSSPIVLDQNTSPTPLVVTTPDSKEIMQPSTNSPIVITTPCPDDTMEDGIITLSPIELATDNVSDVNPVTTTTSSPDVIPDTLDTATDAYNKQDDTRNDSSSSSEVTNIVDKVQQYSTTTVSPSSSVSPPDHESNDETIEKIANDAQTNSKNLTSNQTRKSDKKASYNSLTNTDVPAESDDSAPVTTAPSVQNDVDTGDTSTTPGDNPLDNNESENDLKITVSTDNDSEDGIITIRIEVSDSTDDAGSSSDDSTLLVSIDTNDDDSKKSKKGGCKNDDDANTGKNVEIDMSNIKGEPTMWIRTTDEDIIDKLTSRNTNFDVIYFFPMANQASFERDKKTTIYCNGTVRIDTTETTWAYKNDPNPTVTKTTEFIQIDKSEA